jgi:DNA-binding Xre family transcriptional regulator
VANLSLLGDNQKRNEKQCRLTSEGQKLLEEEISRRRISAKKLAEEAGISRDTVAKIRQAKEPATLNNIDKLFSSLNLDLEENHYESAVIGNSRKPKQQKLKYSELVNILTSDEGCVPEKLIAAYHACLPPGWIRPAVTKLTEILIDLQDIPPGEIGYETIFQFIARLIVAPDIPSSMQQNLEAWLNSKVPDIQQLLDRVNPQPESESFYLMIWLKTAPQEINRYFVRAWFASEISGQTGINWEKEPLLLPKLENLTFTLNQISDEILPSLLIECGRNRCAQSDLTIEFFLPHSLFNHEVDQWLIKESLELPIGVEYRVVVRSEERLSLPYLRKRKEWEKKWLQLNKLSCSPCTELFISGDCHWRELYAKLTDKNSESILGCQMTSVPNLSAQGNVFNAILQSAAPVAVWLRQSLEIDCQNALNPVLNCSIAELPDAVQNCRKEAFISSSEPHIGIHLALLWEDPHRLPPDITPLLMP